MKKTICVGLLGATLLGAVGTASAVSFDLTGQGGTAGDSIIIDFSTLDWGDSPALIKDGVPVTEGDKFTLYGHSTLNAFEQNGLSVDTSAFGTLNTTFEVTMVFGFGEQTTDVTLLGGRPTAAFAFDGSNEVNFFEIYINTFTGAQAPGAQADPSLNGDNSAGTGYRDGVLIAGGKVVDALGSFTLTSANAGALDQAGGTNNLPGINTVGGSGFTGLVATVGASSINRNYFLDVPLDFSFVLTDPNIGNSVPFTEVDPANHFDGMTGTIDGINGSGDIQIGTLNGGTGPDMLLQTDPSVTINVVPEPGTMILLGSGLLGLAGTARRRMKK